MIGFDFAVNLNLGIIDGLLISSIQSKLVETTFKNQVTTPGLIVYVDETCGDQIIINPMQFLFRLQRQFEWKEIGTNFIIATNLIELLSNNKIGLQATMRFVDNNKYEEIDIMNKSKEYVKFDLNENALDNVCGLGYRFFMKDDESINEFKVEPMIKDKQTLFFEGLYNSSNLKLEEVGKICNASYDDFTKKVDHFIEIF